MNTKQELIKQAIESAKCRIYKLNFDLDGKISSHHQKKAENQKELMQITVQALEKQIEMKAIDRECPVCGELIERWDWNYCVKCGQSIY